MAAEKMHSPSNNFLRFPLHGIIGVVVVALAEVALFAGVAVVGVYFTPIVWTGYILIVDGLLASRHRSLIRTYPRQFVLMALWSILCWLVFEGYNVHLENWTYTGLPEEVLPRLFGYGWSFATIFPSILLTARFLEGALPEKKARFRFSLSPRLLVISITLGVAMLIVPLLLPGEAASATFGLVWIGFVLLLDPVNYLRGRKSVLGQLSQGNVRLLLSLVLAGLFCGVLWEFWNYWATAKWKYTIPMSFAGPRIFEMPLLGYLGFIPFAVECYVMYEFLYVLVPRLAERA